MTEQVATKSYNFPSSYPTEEGMDTLGLIMRDVEKIFFNSPMNGIQKIGAGGFSQGITLDASYEGSEDEIWRSYVFYNNHINGFQIPDFKFQISSKGGYRGWVPSLEYELKIWEVLNRYKDLAEDREDD